jgi:hypothetical protein
MAFKRLFRALRDTKDHVSGLENSGITQTNLEITRAARFFSGLLGQHDYPNLPWSYDGGKER